MHWILYSGILYLLCIHSHTDTYLYYIPLHPSFFTKKTKLSYSTLAQLIICQICRHFSCSTTTSLSLFRTGLLLLFSFLTWSSCHWQVYSCHAFTSHLAQLLLIFDCVLFHLSQVLSVSDQFGTFCCLYFI